MKIMFVHGIGFHEDNTELARWSAAWSKAIQDACARAGVSLPFNEPLGADAKPGGNDDHGILYYEGLIKEYPAPSGPEYVAVVSSLLRSYFATKIGDFFGRERGWLVSDELKWKAREVAAWANNDKMRTALRRRVVEEIRKKDPDVVVAHSYGGLITYDACLFEDPDLLDDKFFVTLGTQIGNPLLRREFGGRQIPVRAKHWFNLYNPGDRVFVAPLDHIRADNFTHVVVAHPNGHDGASYLGHTITADRVWRAISQGDTWVGRTREIRSLASNVERAPVNRALLIGIDEYAAPEIPPLKGCVNDTFLLSAALQESGIPPGSIRMLHNARATRANLITNLEWLLADVRPGDHRFFSFSGHGHRMASYNVEGEPDQMEEILVTYDYAFTQDTGLRDRDFQDIYADLPEAVHFMIFLDCCHSGGVTRAGGPLVRAFSGPADVEHDSVVWNVEQQMWLQAGLAGTKGINKEFLPKTGMDAESKKQLKTLYYGQNGDVRRIGRATELRDVSYKKYDRIKAKLDKNHPEAKGKGPYLPLVFMACEEVEKASEYVHGSVSYGAFTFAMVQVLRDRDRPEKLTYGQLMDRAKTKLKAIGYPQSPNILAHERQKNTPVPFRMHALAAAPKAAKPRAAAKPKKPKKRPRK